MSIQHRRHSGYGQAAVHHQSMPNNVRCLLRTQPDNGVGDIFRRRETAQGNGRLDLRAQSVCIRRVVQTRGPVRRIPPRSATEVPARHGPSARACGHRWSPERRPPGRKPPPPARYRGCRRLPVRSFPRNQTSTHAPLLSAFSANHHDGRVFKAPAKTTCRHRDTHRGQGPFQTQSPIFPET